MAAAEVRTDRRWPRRVFGQGDEPDPRYTFANERTYLAWIRSALALLAAGVAVDLVDLSPERVKDVLAFVLVVEAGVCSVFAWLKWATAEAAMRTGRPLPSPAFGMLFVLAGVLAPVVVLMVQFWPDGA